MDKNIRLAFIIATFKNAWFWLGIWVLFYLNITDYSGIGLIESSLFFTVLLLEVPTGAIADLLGRKITLVVSFILSTVCNILIAYAWNTGSLVFAVLFGGVAISLYSGAFDALLYDSLLESKKVSLFNNVISKINSSQLVMMAVCSVIGGFLYPLDNRLPFLLAALFSFFAAALCLFLIEPHLDTEKFSFNAYLRQNIDGFRHLFNPGLTNIVVFLIIVSSMYALSDEMLDSILGFEFGLSSQMLGILFSAISLTSAFFSYISGKVDESKNIIYLVLLITFGSALTYVLSPIAGIVLGSILLTARTVFMSVHHNFQSVLLNQKISSRYRATTLSAFNLIKTLPYAALAPLLGVYMQQISAKSFSLLIGFVLALTVIIQYLFSSASRNSVPTLKQP